MFGEKDYQQLQVIRRLASDLNLATRILGGATVRAPDGLALSSRNAYLTAAQRPVAGRLNVIMVDAAKALSAGEAIERVEARGLAALLAAGFDSVDYFEFRDAADLSRPSDGVPPRPVRLFAAARLGTTRLIDNIAVAL